MSGPKNETFDSPRGSGKTYTLGFVLSVLLTLAAYIPVAHHVHSHHLLYSDRFLVAFAIVLAVVQLFVQMVFFLHLGREGRPRWNLTAFLFMLMVIVIVVIGSLWVMAHLNANMSPEDQSQELIKEEGIHR